MRYKYEPCPRCIKNGKDSRGDNLVVYASGHGHCFACSYHKFPDHYTPQLKVDNVPKSLRPADFTREIPARAWQWVLQYGLPYTYWQECAGYSEERGERFVFQVKTGGNLAFSIGRLLSEEQRKDGGSAPYAPNGGDNYLHGTSPGERSKQIQHVRPRKWYVWGDSHRHCEVVGRQHDSRSIVLVEDIVSAHKVGQINEAIPLFGTQVPVSYTHLTLPTICSV